MKNPNDKILKDLKNTLASVNKMIEAIGEGGDTPVTPYDMDVLGREINQFEISSWVKNSPDQQQIQDIISDYKSLELDANGLPDSDNDVNTSKLKDIQTNVQTLIANFQIKPKDAGSDTKVDLQMLLRSVNNIIEAISEGGDEPISQADMDELSSQIELFRDWKTSDKFTKKIVHDFDHLQLDSFDMPQSDNEDNSNLLANIALNIKKMMAASSATDSEKNAA